VSTPLDSRDLSADFFGWADVPLEHARQRGHGETIIWRQVAPERFETTAVRAEPLAADRVGIAAGLEVGASVAMRGAGFINQIR